MSEAHVARKRFGQNFLVDHGVIDRILDEIDPRPGDHLVEIGPGLGALTEPLLRRHGFLDVIELDRDLVQRLRERHPPERLRVHAADALDFDFGALGKALRVVGNLPYNISTPLLFHLAAHRSNLRDCHFMLQKEVVDRMAAEPGSRVYGRLSVAIQVPFLVEPLFSVPAMAFRPAPKVESAVVRLCPRGPGEPRPRDLAWFDEVVRRAFGQRRKTVRNALASLLTEAELRAQGIAPSARAETLTPAQYITLADYLSQRRGVAPPPATDLADAQE